jgi:hypothetical protein
MRTLLRLFCIMGVLPVIVAMASPLSKAASGDDDRSVVIIFKDGHRQTFRLTDIARIEFSTPATTTPSPVSRAHFLGEWKVGIGGDNSGTFTITLKRDGVAEKSMGTHVGTWKVVNGAAQCTWDDGWTDVIRRNGSKWEKAAWSSGRSLDEPPDNVAAAVYTEPN